MNQEPDKILLREVGPRDGLQNEADNIATDIKIRFIELLWATGVPYLEVTSFVNPSWVPQLADADEVFSRVRHLGEAGRRMVALVPNMRGYERARDVGCENIAVFTSASERFNMKNTNVSIEDSLTRFRTICQAADREGVWVRGYISTAFSCPYSGDVDPDVVATIALKLAEMGCSEVVISDTTGQAFPDHVAQVIDRVLLDVPKEILALHMHNTHGRAIENVDRGWRMGIRRFDSATGGLGGCPYSPGASGNIGTEALLNHFKKLGLDTQVDVQGFERATEFIGAHIPGLEERSN